METELEREVVRKRFQKLTCHHGQELPIPHHGRQHTEDLSSSQTRKNRSIHEPKDTKLYIMKCMRTNQLYLNFV